MVKSITFYFSNYMANPVVKFVFKDPNRDRIIPVNLVHKLIATAFILGSILAGSITAERDESWNAQDFYIRLKNGQAAKMEIVEFLSNPAKIREMEQLLESNQETSETLSINNADISPLRVVNGDGEEVTLVVGDRRIRTDSFQLSNQIAEISYPNLSLDTHGLTLNINENNDSSQFNANQISFNDLLRKSNALNELLMIISNGDITVETILSKLPESNRVYCDSSTNYSAVLDGESVIPDGINGYLLINSNNPLQLSAAPELSIFASYGIGFHELTVHEIRSSQDPSYKATVQELESEGNFEALSEIHDLYERAIKDLYSACQIDFDGLGEG